KGTFEGRRVILNAPPRQPGGSGWTDSASGSRLLDEYDWSEQRKGKRAGCSREATGASGQQWQTGAVPREPGLLDMPARTAARRGRGAGETKVDVSPPRSLVRFRLKKPLFSSGFFLNTRSVKASEFFALPASLAPFAAHFPAELPPWEWLK